GILKPQLPWAQRMCGLVRPCLGGANSGLDFAPLQLFPERRRSFEPNNADVIGRPETGRNDVILVDRSTRPETAMNKRRILVVDDDADLRETLVEQLKGQPEFDIVEAG